DEVSFLKTTSGPPGRSFAILASPDRDRARMRNAKLEAPPRLSLDLARTPRPGPVQRRHCSSNLDQRRKGHRLRQYAGANQASDRETFTMDDVLLLPPAGAQDDFPRSF